MTFGGKYPMMAGKSVAPVRQVLGLRSSEWDPMAMIVPGMMFPPGTPIRPQMAIRIISR